MDWNTILLIAIGVTIFAISVSMVSSYFTHRNKRNGIDDFLLAGKTLSASSIVSLLLSSSFGVNAVVYAAWLGYTIGGWALIIQFTWAASFVLLGYKGEKFTGISSLHDLLGKFFGQTTKIVASICSLVGILFFVGWELEIGRVSMVLFSEESTSLIGAEEDGSRLKSNLLIGVIDWHCYIFYDRWIKRELSSKYYI